MSTFGRHELGTRKKKQNVFLQIDPFGKKNPFGLKNRSSCTLYPENTAPLKLNFF